MKNHQKWPFHVEWLPIRRFQGYTGPRSRMKQYLGKYGNSNKAPLAQLKVIEYLFESFPNEVNSIMKIKFYRTPEDSTILNFIVIWCDYNAQARDTLYKMARKVVEDTGWYPVITGHRVFHRERTFTDHVDLAFQESMPRETVENIRGLGFIEGIHNFSDGQGTSILLQTSNYDIILDAGMSADELKFDQLRKNKGKWLFISHAHDDHCGGLEYFLSKRDYYLSISAVSLEFYLLAKENLISHSQSAVHKYYYRIAPLWYGTKYNFKDGSSIKTIPTYHFPGSMGLIFTFADNKRLFYSGDLNISASYLMENQPGSERKLSFDIGDEIINYALFEGAFIGRNIGTHINPNENLIGRINESVSNNTNHILLSAPSDYGLYMYLYLYDFAISGANKTNVRIFLDPIIITQLEMLGWRIKRGLWNEIDGSLNRFGFKTLAESAKVFDIQTNLHSNIEYYLSKQVPMLFILDDKKIGSNDYFPIELLTKISETGLNITRVGRACGKPLEPKVFNETNLVDFNEGSWFMHTPENMLKEYLLSHQQEYNQILLFHNFKKRLERFSKEMTNSGFTKPISPLTDHIFNPQ